MKKAFLFIDEFGDTGNDLSVSSSHFGFCILHTNGKGLSHLIKHYSRFRYFTDMSKELKGSYQVKYRSIHKDLLKTICSMSDINVSFSFINKRKYQGPYFNTEHHNSNKLRNFLLRKSLESFWEDHEPLANERELVFDRYNTSSAYVENLKSYLSNNYDLPSFDEIVQVNSVYSEPIQIVDLLIRVIREEMKNKTTNDFYKIYNLNSI